MCYKKDANRCHYQRLRITPCKSVGTRFNNMLSVIYEHVTNWFNLFIYIHVNKYLITSS